MYTLDTTSYIEKAEMQSVSYMYLFLSHGEISSALSLKEQPKQENWSINF